MKKILFLLTLLFSANLYAQAISCEGIEPKINIRINQKAPTYITHMTRQQFMEKENVQNKNTIGLTVAEIGISQKFEYLYGPEKNGMYCATVQSIDFEIGYKRLLVYIDSKYKSNSCEYRETKEHEDYHVSVAQQAFEFFEPDIRRALEKMKNASFVSFNYTQQGAIDDVQRKISERSQLYVAPILAHINKKISEKNAEIDTPESYAATHKLCKNW